MKYQEFLDHLLGVYYYISKSNPRIAITPFWVVDIIKEGHSSSNVKDIMNYLGAEGYLDHYFQKSGDVSRITSRGKIYYENLDQEYTERIEKFLEREGILKIIKEIKSTSDSDFINKDHPDKLIKDIEKDLKKLEGIDKDVLKDLEVIKIEFQKRSPNREVLRIKIEDLMEDNILYDKFQELKYRLSL